MLVEPYYKGSRIKFGMTHATPFPRRDYPSKGKVPAQESERAEGVLYSYNYHRVAKAIESELLPNGDLIQIDDGLSGFFVL